MMQPLSLQNRPMTGLTPPVSYGATAVRQDATQAPAQNAATAGSPQMDFSALLMPLLTLITQILKMAMGGQGSQTAGAQPPASGAADSTNQAGTPTASTGANGGTTASGGSPVPEAGSPYGNTSPITATQPPGGVQTGNADQTAGNPQPNGVDSNDNGAVDETGYGATGAGGTTGAGGATNTGGADATQPEGTTNTGDAGSQGTLGSAANMTINERRNLNYSNLKADPNGGNDYQNVRGGKQAFNGVSGTDAAIMHLAGRGHISAGDSANGVSGTARIYNNVLNDKNNMFSPDEHALIQKYAQAEKAKYGYFTGENLDHAFIDQMAQRGEIDPTKVQQYHQAVDARVAKQVNNPNQAAVAKEAGQPVNFTSDIGTLEKQSGMSKYEQAVYRLAGHSTLFSGDGSINGDILGITLGNKNSLDGRDFNGQNTNIDKETLSLLQDDLASDGKLNGDSLRYANEKVLDNVYLGKPQVNAQDVKQHAIQQGQANGRSSQTIMKSLQTSANDALKQFGDFATKHPAITAAGAAALGAGAAVCPFLAGTMAVGAGVAAGAKAMNDHAKPAGSQNAAA